MVIMVIPIITQKVRAALHQLLQREAAAVLQPPHVSVVFFVFVVVVVVVVLVLVLVVLQPPHVLADCPAVSFRIVYLHKNNHMWVSLGR